MAHKVIRKTPGKVPGLDFVQTIANMEVESKASPLKPSFVEEIGKEIQAEVEEDLITITARVPRSLMKKIRTEAFNKEMSLGTYLRKFLIHTFR